jgi:glycosyltransferase involved in cell wall biosynthesis
MKILIHQFLGKNHSWSVCGWGIATAAKQLGHEVDLFSTDGIKHLPSHLEENLIGYTEENQSKVFGKMPTDNYDCQISYTSMKNFSQYLTRSNKNRFGIWCYEWVGENCLPTGFAKQYKSCDHLLSPSNFVKEEIFIPSGIPANVIDVVPHGIDIGKYKLDTKIPLPTKKNFKILANIAQNHMRKNIPGLLEAYGKAFTNKDDVCLILKAREKKPTMDFEISLSHCIADFKRKYPNHAELRLFTDFLEDISVLYRSIDAVFTMSYGEGFYFPGLEGIASGKMSIAPDNGGHRDFLNKSNTLLVESKKVRANPKSMYWEQKNNVFWYEPSIDDAVSQLRHAYKNFEEINKGVEKQRSEVLVKYDWKNIFTPVLNSCL